MSIIERGMLASLSHTLLERACARLAGLPTRRQRLTRGSFLVLHLIASKSYRLDGTIGTLIHALIGAVSILAVHDN